MAPISLKVVLDEGAVVKTVAFDSTMRVSEAFDVIMEKLHTGSDGKDYALFLTSTTDDLSGVWLEGHRTLEYYMLREGDSLHCLDRRQNLRIRMLDGSVKTLQVDTSKKLGDLMMTICDKIGITNHDEYGLCREETKTLEEAKPTSITGTLTLKRKAQQKEKDSKMEQLSKKLKTDDNVSWLDQHKTLREIGMDSSETLLLKRRLFYSDRNVDSRDPVQLNLLYVQTRDAILEGRHPVTEEQALEFAGIQCQIQHGDHQEDKHKPGLIENLNEYLPVQYSSTWGAEKKILKLHKKHAGLSQLEAKHLYTKTARELPTYGVTFFVVKEKQKGKKKLVPRLLGISSEAILRLDEITKEVLQAWPLTQVMTYHASHNDTFSLNFGDYSEKEYSVKTNDAYRIRDILEGYIDIIRKRQGAPYGVELPESGSVLQESVQHGRSNVITHVVHVPSKAVEHSYIGPSRIIQEGQAGESSHGTQIVTVQQMLVTQRGTTQQQAVTGEVPMRRDMSLQFTRKLNKMNANSVKIVTLLSDPTAENLKEVQKIKEDMKADMPHIAQGVREVAEKQKTEAERNKLLAELDELLCLLDSLSSNENQENMKNYDVEEIAKKIADLTTQMYLNLDPRVKRQSKIIRTSRPSFIEDDKVEANIRRASFIVAAGSACGSIDNAKETLTKGYDGAVPTELEHQALQLSVVDKMGKLNAAIAILLTSHSDPNNPDYSAAVTSMNTINELVPELAKDTKSMGSVLDNESRQALLEDLLALYSAVRQVCALVGSEDKEKMQEETDKYSEVSGRLLFRLGRNPRAVDPEKSEEIIDLAKEAVATTTILLMKVNELTSLMPDVDASAKVDAEGVKCGDIARELLVCAQLTASTIHEPHCRSALTAAAENLSSSSQSLALAWRPLVEDPSRVQICEDLRERTMDVAKALDRLRNAYANLQAAEPIDQDQEPTLEDVERLKFITTTSNAQDLVKAAADQLDKPIEDVSLSPLHRKELEIALTKKISQVNAAVASLIQAMSDPKKPDHNTAELAIGTISELMPTMMQDAKMLIASSSEMEYRKALLDDIKTWCEAVNTVCAGATNHNTQELKDSAQKFAKASQKLSFVFSPRAHRAREQLLLELSSLAHERATALVDDSNKMADLVGEASASRLREHGITVDNATKALSVTAQLTIPHIQDSRCRSALLNSTELLSSSSHDLVSESQNLRDDETGCKVLESKVYQRRKEIENKGKMLEKTLQGLRETCWTVGDSKETPEQKTQRLKFIATLPTAQKKLESAEDRINSKPASSKKLKEVEAKQLKDKLDKDLVTLKFAVALLIKTSDPHEKDYASAEEAVCTITDLLPSVVDDTKAIIDSDKKADTKAALNNLKALTDALKGICIAVERDDVKGLDTSAKKLAEASEKLSFVLHPRKKQPQEEQLAALCTSASAEARRMVEAARRTAQELDGVARYKLSEGADRLLDASDALVTTAQLTSSSIDDPPCKTVLTTSVDNVLLTAKALVALIQAVPDHSCKEKAEELERRSFLLEDAVNKIKENINAEVKNSRVLPKVPVKKSTLTSKPQIREEEENHYQTPKTAARAIKTSDLDKLATHNFLHKLRAEESSNSTESPEQRNQRLKFIATLPTAQKKLQSAGDKINSKSATTKMLNEVEAKQLKDKLYKDLATLKSAVALLIQAQSDPHRKDYANAEQAICTITDLMPSVIDDSKDITNNDKKIDIKTTLDYLKALNDALKGICVAAERNDAKILDTSAKKLAEVSEKLSFVFHPRKKQPKEEQLATLCTSASAEAHRMVEEARRIAQELNGVARYKLSEGADRLLDASDALVTTAQLTSSNIDDPRCKTVFTSSADNLLLTIKALVASVHEVPHHSCKEKNVELERRSSLVEDLVKKIKQTVNAEVKKSQGSPPVPVKKSTLTSKPQNKEGENHYQIPKTEPKAFKTSDLEKLATHGFIDTLRAEESSNISGVSSVIDRIIDKEIQENKKLKQEFSKILQESEKDIKIAIKELHKVKNSSKKTVLPEEEKELLEKQLEEILASASVAASTLVAAKNQDCLDYDMAKNSIQNMSTVVPEFAKDVVILSTICDDKQKNAILEEAVNLCEGANKLCIATPNEIQEFNEAAVKMADTIARLLYTISPCADPEQEKHVIDAAKAIGDSAYRVAVAGADVVRGADENYAQAVCDAGSKTAHTAGVLVYTAKLVAPSIHHKECQNQLIEASKNLSSDLAIYMSTFKTLQPKGDGVTDLVIEAENLEKLLQGFRKNLGEGKLVKRKTLEKVVIEDTALRQMAVKILQDAEARSKSKNLPEDFQRKFEVYRNKLAEAIKSLDMANHKCHQMPDDLNKRKELESSIHRLQFILLQSKPTIDEREQNNVVDLTDYVIDVSEKAGKLTQNVNEINLTQCEKAAMIIKDECNSIKQNAMSFINPAELPNREDSLGGILEVDQFGQDCENRVGRIKSAVELIEDEKAQIILEDNTVPLTESVNLLRFATKSALAVAQSAALDETIADLTDLQKNIDILLTSGAKNNVSLNKTSSPALTASQARLVRCTMEVSRGNAHTLASAAAAYIIDIRDVTHPSHSDKLKLHANKLIESLKLLAAATSTRVAMFEAVPDAEIIKITQKVLEDIENYTITDDKAEKIQLIKENDIAQFLLPKKVVNTEDPKAVAEKLQQVSTKLNSLIKTVYQSASKPESFSKTVKMTLDTAADLANTAKSLKTGDVAKDKKIDDDVDDMIWTTFGLFKAAEIVSKDPKNDAAKRSLLDACRLLNDSINKLARTANTSKTLKTQCSEYKRTLHMQELLNKSYARSPVCSVAYTECISELENQQNVLMEAMKLDSEEPISRKEFTESLGFVSTAVCNSTKFAAHSAYLLSISESNQETPIVGVVDVTKLRQVTSSMKDSALMILRSQQIEQAKAEEIQVKKMAEDLKTLIKESSDRINNENTRRDLIDVGAKVDTAANVLRNAVYNKDTDMGNVYSATASFLNAVSVLGSVVERPTIVPQISHITPQMKAMSEDVLGHSKDLLNKADALMTNVAMSSHEEDDDEEPMTWVTFNHSRKSLMDALEKLINCLRENGKKAGIIATSATEPSTEKTEIENRSYLQIQVDAVNKWLCKRPLKPEVKSQGEEATRNILDIGEKMLEDLNGHELEEMHHLLTETDELLKECSKSYDNDKARALIDKAGDLRKAIERCIVSRVVDDFTDAEEPMADLEVFVDIETDEKKRKFLLEQKIAELLAQLGKVKKTARVVADVHGGAVSKEIDKCSQQTELLAPQLVKAAEERVRTPHSPLVVENYRTLLAQYAESLSKVRDLCDRSVDPMEFVQTAGDKMQRLREESHQTIEPQRCAYTSIVIRRLANRVVEVGMSSSNAREDAEMMEVLSEAKKRLAVPPPAARASRLPDWRTITADILRATSEVESVLGGESIFKKQPEPDQPIYNAALSLHTVVREWSARDNEVVAVAKRMAVLMAKLSDYMNHDKKAELIATSKSIVVQSHEVARLARKLALECSDMRIRTNLLQACERIPTISGQLKMLTTVKGSSLGHQRSEEDKEAMDMLVGNAQNLMLSVQEVVKGAESASVKIASQRGMRIKWVRKNYY